MSQPSVNMASLLLLKTDSKWVRMTRAEKRDARWAARDAADAIDEADDREIIDLTMESDEEGERKRDGPNQKPRVE